MTCRPSWFPASDRGDWAVPLGMTCSGALRGLILLFRHNDLLREVSRSIIAPF